MNSGNRRGNRDTRDSAGELVTGIGNPVGKSVFYDNDSNSDSNPRKVKIDNEPSFQSLQESVSSSEKVLYYGPMKVASSIRSSASQDHTNDQQFVLAEAQPGLRDSYASVTSQDVGSLQRKTQSSYYPIESQEIRIVVVGSKFTGKTQLIRRALGKKFSCQYNPDSIIKAHSKAVGYGQHTYTVILLELPEDALTKEERGVKDFFSGVMAAFVVYDMSNKESLSATVEWKKRINNSVCMLSGDPIPVYLLGNKCDARGQHYDGASTGEKHKFTDYLKTSAKTGAGIDVAVRNAVEKVLKESYPNLPPVCETPPHLKSK